MDQKTRNKTAKKRLGIKDRLAIFLVIAALKLASREMRMAIAESCLQVGGFVEVHIQDGTQLFQDRNLMH